MSSLAISDVAWLSKRIKACCRRAKLFSTHELLLAPPLHLQHALRLTPPEVELLLLQVATAAKAPTVSVLDALNGVAPPPLADDLFGEHSDDSSDSHTDDEPIHDDPRLVPPTQGYDGNFPGAHQFVYDSEDDDDDDDEDSSTGLNDDDAESTRPLDTHDPTEWHDSEPARTRDALVHGRARHVYTTGSLELDALLSGGLRCSLLTEIVGESASGKTQIAIQACAFAALGLSPLASSTPPPSQEGFDDGVGVCYITSSGERAAHSIVARALELASFAIRHRFPPHPNEDDLERAVELGRAQLLRNLHVACVADIEALDHVLRYQLPALTSRTDIGIVVVDNLPALFQDDPVAGDIDSLVHRSRWLVDVADALKRTSAAVVVINHVSDAFGIDKDLARRFVFDSASRTSRRTDVVADHPAAMEYAAQSAYTSGLLASVPPTLAAAMTTTADSDSPLYTLHPRTAQLGHTWTNLIHTRLLLTRTNGRVKDPDDDHRYTHVRKAAVVLNPAGPSMLDLPASQAHLRFIITPASAVHALAPYTLHES
ncbi:hypothetical protein PANT_19c00014 [Moesziomyces antarcticus T-34]|uniref:RecA family profile 1 domain-containing protein n=1 Tax=Pseudozyma antarctica (strain T-34) TaxID=1151754 RepID=M9LRR3_PSEA3|nr:hypothetical protein PANT_19c00014 [Moesziomyces antarcticus T-34]